MIGFNMDLDGPVSPPIIQLIQWGGRKGGVPAALTFCTPYTQRTNSAVLVGFLLEN